MSAPARHDDYQAEARQLTEWLFTQAAFYRTHAPACAVDIQRFEDAAALIDSFRAGLVLVPPHPAMHAELIRWTPTAAGLPAEGQLVLIWDEGDDSPWIGYLDGRAWRSIEGFPIPMKAATHWSAMPTGPAPLPTLESRHEETEA